MDAIDALGTCRHRMTEDLKLLQSALEAARNGRMHVVIDHIERVMESQQRALQATKHRT